MEKFMNTTSKNVRSHIHDDIAFSILSKLPIKSLKRFGCICKLWAFLFENYYFMDIYRNNFICRTHSKYVGTSYLFNQVGNFYQESTSDLFLFSGERFERKVKLNHSIPIKDIDKTITIFGSHSINGILCINFDNIFALWNPFTEEVKVIPPSSIESIPYRIVRPCIYGFGYDNVMDDYKVIRRVVFDELSYMDYTGLDLDFDDIPWDDISYEPSCEIYSLRSNSWRKINVDVHLNNQWQIVQFYNDGICHWWNNDINYLYDTCLMSFDMSNEVLFKTPMPLDKDDNLDLKWVERHLIMLINEYVSLISFHEDTTTFHISILGEIGVKESWNKLFIIGPFPYVLKPVGAGTKGDILFVKENRELVCFNLGTTMIEEVGVQWIIDQMIIYKESLLSIREINK